MMRNGVSWLNGFSYESSIMEVADRLGLAGRVEY